MAQAVFLLMPFFILVLFHCLWDEVGELWQNPQAVNQVANILNLKAIILALMELLRGQSTWVEQRVVVRALGHLVIYGSTFPDVATNRDILELAIQLTINAVKIVYTHFLQFVNKQMSYHYDLLTRGMGGLEMESQKAKKWASQLQC